MSNNQLQLASPIEEELLTIRLQRILQNEALQDQQALLVALAAQLRVDVLDCAAALLSVLQQDGYTVTLSRDRLTATVRVDLGTPVACANIHILEPVVADNVMPAMKMVRYRLDIGKKHQITVKELKKILVEESGVDINNINNVMIHGQYTLIELPDEMPQDIFLHLKTVEINQQKLDIKRLKSRTKKQLNNRFRRTKSRTSKASSGDSA
jgi:DbpA RNA binding domain